MERVLVLGAGFGGLELATVLSDVLGEDAGVTLIDAGEGFVFGYSKLDVLFGRATPAEVRIRYDDLAKPGVRFVRQRVTAIDPEARRVTTDEGEYDADVLVVALGADYDLDATPGVAGHEFYSVAGAERMRDVLSSFAGGHAVVGICGAPFKCPPAPSEAALLLHDHLVGRGLRDDSEISLVMPFPTPVPPSPDTSAALLEAFAERGIAFVPEKRVTAYDEERGAVALDDGSKLFCDLFLGVPRHRAPDVVLASGLAEDGYVPVDGRTLETRVPGVYAVGDVATVGVPKAGVFSERQARVVAAAIVARRRGEEPTEVFDGRGNCYVEFGAGRVGRVDVDFFSGPKPTGTLVEPSVALVEEKNEFGSSRRARWFSR
ncbi:MAG TPA: FAD-dependent oxidoreductase [Gaiellaceae bacterium]|nr:FAD-dependent oxidoreductase [Gaiellaceae bacterium]